MTINNYVDTVESAARYALGKSGAIEVCARHPEVTIRAGDPDAERHAYALATTLLKSDGTMWMREELIEAIKDDLEMAADDGCPACGA